MTVTELKNLQFMLDFLLWKIFSQTLTKKLKISNDQVSRWIKETQLYISNKIHSFKQLRDNILRTYIIFEKNA